MTRVGDYEAFARQGAPQAIQVADRFHFYKNLVEAVELILARCRAEIRKNAQSVVQGELQEATTKPLLYEHAEVIAVENWNSGNSFIIGRERSLMAGWRKVLPARSANSRAL